MADGNNPARTLLANLLIGMRHSLGECFATFRDKRTLYKQMVNQ
ncbi:hypothetical protein [Leisingera aquaemixtae]|nr:hypothetical protein [Leisingera aquaemixtae]